MIIDRKQVIIHNDQSGESYFINLSNEQISLLDWLFEREIICTDFFGYVIINPERFENIT